MVNYTVTFVQDVYTIINNEEESIDFVLKSINSCSTREEIISSITIEEGDSYTLPLSDDSVYSGTLTSSTETSEFTIDYYQNLQLSMLQDVYSVLCTCDCGCTDCVDLSTKPLETLLTAVNRAEMYILLSSPRYNAYVEVANKSANCLILPELYCGVKQEWITGEIEYSEKLTKQLLALKYLGMYFQESAALTEQDDIDYVDGKFMIESILCCINKLGVDIEEVKQNIEDSMAVMTINTGAYQNQIPVTADKTLTTTNRTSLAIQLSDFPYTDPEGTDIYAVRIDSILAGVPTGTLTWDGVDVVAGDVLLASDFATKTLLFTPPDTDDADTDVFSFSVQDSDLGWSTN